MALDKTAELKSDSDETLMVWQQTDKEQTECEEIEYLRVDSEEIQQVTLLDPDSEVMAAVPLQADKMKYRIVFDKTALPLQADSDAAPQIHSPHLEGDRMRMARGQNAWHKRQLRPDRTVWLHPDSDKRQSL